MVSYAVVDVVSPSVVHCSLSHAHISKTEQDRPIVTMEHYYEVGITDSVSAFRSSSDAT